MNQRIKQINELLQREVGSLIAKESELPEGAVITITRVDASPNLQQAKVYISVIPEEQKENALLLLRRNIFNIQQDLNKRLHMRPVPKIIWVDDKGSKEVGRVEEILDNIQKEE
ncbi:MAG: 30S ribosome-binding factor RbfA [Patescibacteria group bacterium]|nr:30S ribosome-binding factor RbfA [Patescibacteria group bacterium]